MVDHRPAGGGRGGGRDGGWNGILSVRGHVLRSTMYTAQLCFENRTRRKSRYVALEQYLSMLPKRLDHNMGHWRSAGSQRHRAEASAYGRPEEDRQVFSYGVDGLEDGGYS